MLLPNRAPYELNCSNSLARLSSSLCPTSALSHVCIYIFCSAGAVCACFTSACVLTFNWCEVRASWERAVTLCPWLRKRCMGPRYLLHAYHPRLGGGTAACQLCGPVSDPLCYVSPAAHSAIRSSLFCQPWPSIIDQTAYRYRSRTQCILRAGKRATSRKTQTIKQQGFTAPITDQLH